MTPSNFPHLLARSSPKSSRTPAPTPAPRLVGGGLREVLAALAPTTHRDTVAAPLLEAVATPFRDSLRQYPWNIPERHHPFLESCGINVAGHGFKAHPHPVHKTIETHLIHDVWPNVATVPSAVMFMKPSKFDKLKAIHPNFEALFNYRLTAKDTTRYPTTSHDLPNFETLFMHDALMYYTPGQIVDLFLERPKLQKVYASLVVPPESQFTDISLFPELYRFRFEGDQLVYELEQNPSHNYIQPKRALDWLTTTTIRSADLTLTVSRLESWGPVHSLLIQRGVPPVHQEVDTVSFKAPRAVALPEPSSLHQDLRHRLVPKDVYDALFIYVRAVRTLRVTDPAGFVRTQCSKPEYAWVTSSAWDNLAHFALSTSPHRPKTTYILFHSSFDKVVHWLKTHKLLMTSAGASLLSVASSSLFLAIGRVLNSHVHSFAVFRRWLKPPPHLLWPPKAPLLELSLRARSTGPTVLSGTPFAFKLLPKTFCRLGASYPSLAKFLPKCPIPRKYLWLSIAAASLPLIALGVRFFLGPDSPQSLHDRYHALFHPEPWELVLKRGPVHVARAPFLPFTPVDHVPLDSDSPAIPAPPVPQPQAPLSPVTPAPVSRDSPTSDPPGRDAEEKAVNAVLSLPSPPSQPPVRPPSPSVQAPASSDDLADRRDAENLAQALSSLGLFTPDPHSEPQQPVVGSSGELHAREWGQEDAPASDPESSPLLRDPSACGPVAMYSELHPGNYVPGTGLFQFRDRASGRAPVPYPSMDCLLVAVEQATRLPKEALWDTLTSACPDSFLNPTEIAAAGLSTDHFAILARHYSLRATFHSGPSTFTIGMEDATSTFAINHTPGQGKLPGHFSLRLDHNSPKLNGGLAQDLAVAALRFNVDGQLLPIRSVHSYRTWPARAKNLISNMKNGFDGVMANIHPTKTTEARERILALDGQLDIAQPRTVRLIHIAGFPGCGKSYPISRLLKTAAFKDHKVAVPTTELRAEWKDMLKPSPAHVWRLGTWESSLLKAARVLVIDEIYKLPRGYLDLAIHADPTIEFVIALGDPLQGEYHSTHPNSSNSRLVGETRHLAPYLDYYCLWSRRVPKLIADFFHVPTSNENPGFARYSRQFPTDARVLTNSQNAMHTMNQCGYQSVTIASSQGSTYSGAACIHLDKNSALLSHGHSLVALTRSRTGVIFTGDPSLLKGASTSNTMFSLLMSGKTRPIQDWFHREFPTCPVLKEPLKQRHNRLTGAHGETLTDPYCLALPIRLSSSPCIKPTEVSDIISADTVVLGDGALNRPQVSTHFLPEARRPLHSDLPSAVPSSELSPSSADFTTPVHEPVYPGETFENLAAHFLPAHDPETREIVFRNTMSNQFPHLNKDFHLSAQPSSLIAAIHSEKDDPTLLPASIGKRLRFRPSDAPYQITSKDEILGQLLYEGWCRAYSRNPNAEEPFDEALFAECINLNEYAQLTSKTQAVIMGNARRSDPDWRWSAVRIFSKAQHKVNEGSIFGSWKACQTLALMHDAVVLILGPVKKYQRMFDQRDRPSHLYIHAGHTPTEMSTWCKKNLTTAVKLANDYTSFDQSQHGEAVVFERKKMERLNIPQHLIDLHCFLKTNVSTQFGPLTCMRLTGEPGTYDDNSDYNLAVINLEYAASAVPTMVSGDDSLLDYEPKVRPEWNAIKPLLALRFKKERGLYATFCGYYCARVGCVRSPIALFAKLMIAEDDGSISDKLASYLMEFSIGHSLGDELWQALPLATVSYQSACFDFFCRRAPPELKLALKLGEVPEEVVARIGHFKWATHATYSLLNSAARQILLHSSRNPRSLPEDPDTTKYQGELLQTLQLSAPLHSMNHSTLLPLTGGSSASAPSLTPLQFSEAVTQSMASNGQVGPPPDRDDRVDRQPRLPVAPRVAEVDLQAPTVDYPFQWVISSYDGSAAKNLTEDLAGSATLSKLTANYRHAELRSVELEVAPLAAAFSKPISISVVWTIASITPATTTETSYYGGRLITVGGPVLLSSTTRIPADLSRLNPILKSSVGYKDTPRLSYTVYANSGTAGTNLCSVIIRGILRLSAPAGNILA
ncbi:polyprotein [Nectarine marafivirus M]|uniref:Polyprotein n=1 Tax=Nectarine marafivirus M TaxID=1778580 RepID=A0A0U4G347_9VIRU|nr:polyprotein [Nectarine marafivirus M]ALX72768.1 polyprotein [Nectarine marafivirus M]